MNSWHINARLNNHSETVQMNLVLYVCVFPQLHIQTTALLLILPYISPCPFHLFYFQAVHPVILNYMDICTWFGQPLKQNETNSSFEVTI